MKKEYPHVTEVLKASGFYSPYCTEDGLVKGSIVHQTIQYLDNGTLHSYDPQIQGYIEAYHRARKETPSLKEILFNETPVVSRLWGFRGTFDRLFVGGSLVDIKTGTPNEATGLQLAAYSEAIRETLNIKVKSRYGLYLAENGRYRLEDYTKPGYWQDFITCLKHLKLRKEYKIC